MGEDVRLTWDIVPLDEVGLLPAAVGESLADAGSQAVQLEFADAVPHADRLDCMAAAGIGVLSGVLNVLWQSGLNLEGARSWGSEKVGAFVVATAGTQGVPAQGSRRERGPSRRNQVP